MEKSKESLHDLLGYQQRSNCELLEFQKEKAKEAESLFKEIMAENIPNLMRDLDIQVHEAHSSPNKLKEILSKIHNNKTVKNQRQRESLKAPREKKLATYKGTPIRLSVDFPVEILQTRRE